MVAKPVSNGVRVRTSDGNGLLLTIANAGNDTMCAPGDSKHRQRQPRSRGEPKQKHTTAAVFNILHASIHSVSLDVGASLLGTVD